MAKGILGDKATNASLTVEDCEYISDSRLKGIPIKNGPENNPDYALAYEWREAAFKWVLKFCNR